MIPAEERGGEPSLTAFVAVSQALAQALAAPHAIAREMVTTVEHPTAGTVKMLGIPFRFSDTPASIRRAPPLLGQHTEAVLREELGFSDARIAELRAEKVI